MRKVLFIDTETRQDTNGRWIITEATCVWYYANGCYLDERTFFFGIGHENVRDWITTTGNELRKSPLKPIVVAHNASYDLRVIKDAYYRSNARGWPPFSVIDTMVEGSKLWPSGKWPKLDDLYFRLHGKHFTGAHTSRADTWAMVRCFWKMVDTGHLTLC